jgi:L-threonylcarbamoyladenylate synthase
MAAVIYICPMTDFEKDIQNCLEVLSKGGIILYPTDTIWGLGCDATNEDAVAGIYQVKQRPAEKSLIVLVADERQVIQYVSQLDLQVFDYLKSYKKPATVIYNGPIGLADNLLSKDGTIAIRIVDDPFCKSLIKRFRKPIVSTSANVSGEPAPARFAEIAGTIKSSADYIVRYRQDDESVRIPSSIIRWNTDGTVTVIRS